MSGCCGAGQHDRPPLATLQEFDTAGKRPAHEEVSLPGGQFAMGDSFGEGKPDDGETPVHLVRVGAFRIDITSVSNEQFAAFVAATGYVTEAEHYGNSAVFAPAVAARRSDIIGGFGPSWWLAVRGANWRHPFGPLSSIEDAQDHPVVQISHNDALAYCGWAGRALPTEAEWEYAARGGHAGRRYPWGNVLVQDGIHRANIWQGRFPDHNTANDGWLTTAPTKSYPANDFGLFQMIGNVWEWCADWFGSDYYRYAPSNNPKGPDTGDARVVRGGSYLCHESYCNRYRVAARTANTPESAASNTGFRTVVRDALGPAGYT